MTAIDLLAREHAQGKILQKIILSNGRMTPERGQCEREDRKPDDQGECAPIGAVEGPPPPGRRLRGGFHLLYATKKQRGRATQSRRLHDTAVKN